MKLGERAFIGPELVQIDLTDECTNNCIGCWARSPFLMDDDHYDTLEKGTLKPEFVFHLLPQFKMQRVREIFLGGGGDPTCYPHLVEVIQQIKKNQLQCTLNTSFACADDALIESLCDVGLDQIIVSLWAGNPAMYARLHPNKSERTFAEVTDHLMNFSRCNTANHAPKVTIYNVVCSLNYRDIPEMIEYARRVGADEVEFSVLDPIPHRTSQFNLTATQIAFIDRFFDSFKQERKPFVHYELFLRRLHNVDVHKGVFDNGIVASIPCAAGWFYSRVTTTGQMHGCLKSHRVPTGELTANSFERIWYGEEHNEFRRHTLHITPNDPYLLKIGHDIKFGLPGCYRTCDNIGKNQEIMKMVGGLTDEEKSLVDRLVEMAKSGASRDELLRVSHGEWSPRTAKLKLLRPPDSGTSIDHAVAAHQANSILESTEASQRIVSQTSQPGLSVASGIDLLHDNIMGQSRGFAKTRGELRKLGVSDWIRIPLIHENIFHLPGTLRFIANETGRPLDGILALDPDPLETLSERVDLYIDNIKEKLLPLRVEIDPARQSLKHLFESIHRTEWSQAERKRALGVATNKALTGPHTFHLDVANACNTNCAPCWFHSPFSANRPDAADFGPQWNSQKIKWDDFTRLADDLAEMNAGEDVVLSGKGEPTLHPRIADMVRYLKDKGLCTTLFSNGINLHRKIAEACVEARCDMIYVSLMAASAATYERNHANAPTGEYDAVLKNLSELIAMKKRRGAKLPKVVLVDVISSLNFDELIAFAKLGIELGVDMLRYQLAAIEPYNKALALNSKQFDKVAKDIASVKILAEEAGIQLIENIDMQLRGRDQNWSREKYLSEGCLAGWTFARVWAGGELSFCCSPKICGNIQDKSFKETWYSEAYDRTRIAAKHMSDNRDFPFDNDRTLFDPICLRCPNYEGIERLRRVISDMRIGRWL